MSALAAGAAPIRLGTRGSALALAQSQRVADSIAARTGTPVELVTISTHGDRSTEPLASLGGVGVFVTAVREALLAGQCDVIVHSLKDLPTTPHAGLAITAVPTRADARDALIARDGLTLEALPAGARVGTGSPRRRAQLRRRRDDLEIVELRGNVDTRIARVLGEDADLDAVVLAVAGLERLGRDDVITEHLGIAGWPTAPGQGALAVETLATVSGPLRSALQGIDHPATRVSVEAERAVLRLLEAGCSAPLGAHAFIDGGMLFLAARVYSVTGDQVSAAHALYVDDTRTPREACGRRAARAGCRRSCAAGCWAMSEPERSIPRRMIPSEMMPSIRPRRLRASAAMRRLVSETDVRPHHLVLPVFVREGLQAPQSIASMPGVEQHSLDSLRALSTRAVEAGLGGIMLFGVPAQRDAIGSSATDPDGILNVAARTVVTEVGDAIVVQTDLCLDEFTDHGHCGVLDSAGRVDNDATLERYAAMAVAQAEAGAQLLGLSGMMDGQVAAVRDALDDEGFASMPILAYSAKYASAFYGPFREAVQSTLVGDRRGYQLDAANGREGIRESLLDIAEGADIIMVKPAMSYLDVLAETAAISDIPVWAYQVSGEYAMIEAAAANGWIDRRRAIEESVLSIRRAGADVVLTYWAVELAKWIR